MNNIQNVITKRKRILIIQIISLILIICYVTSCGDQSPKLGEWYYLGFGNETVTSIAVDSEDKNIIYVGTDSDFSLGVHGNLFKSTDAGKTWDTLVIGGSYKNIIIDPTNPNIIYAMPSSLIKSKDAGETWQYIIDGITLDWETRIQSLAINPQNPEVLYAGTGGFNGGNLYKSHNGGLTWNTVPSDSLREGVISIAVDPVDTNIVYAGTAWRCFVWKSTDAGKTWFNTEANNEGAPIYDILIDPNNNSTVYVCSRGVFKSEDGGINWSNISNGLPVDFYNVMKIQQSSSSRLFLVATYGDDGGIYEYIESEDKWNRIGIDSLNVSYYYSDLKFYSDPDRLYFGGKGLYMQYIFHEAQF